MPARRELHTGRYNFLHRGWGPLEPFDDSMPELLKNSGVYTHLCTDHYHYWQDGGATYHNRYSSYELFRGQEGDAWKAEVNRPDLSVLHDTTRIRRQFSSALMEQDLINRKYMTCDAEMPQSQTFANGLAFLEKNHAEDNWFLSIETFDPHEPFFVQDEYKKLYPHEYHGKLFDWPNYASVTEGDEALNHVRMEYAAHSALLLPMEAHFRRAKGRIDIASINAFLDTLKDGPMKPLCYGARMLTGDFLPLEKE